MNTIDMKIISVDTDGNVTFTFSNIGGIAVGTTKLAQKYKFSVNGLKKVLTNQTYLGKIKFDGQTYQGSHQCLVSSTLFNHVQNKLEKLGIK